MKTPVLTAKAVFDQAHEITSPDERKAYLDQACADAPEVRRQVEALLKAFVEAGSFLEKPAGPMPPTGPYQLGADTSGEMPGVLPETTDDLPRTGGPVRAEGPGTQIGPYRLVRRLGAGGMGAVYLAEQDRPIRRQVALKVIKPGMDSDQVVARFNAERQALTLMDHVNIARVFDAGATETGRPYFVMELVQGTALTRFCDENALTVRERLGLFVSVCQAVQHAHQKGVIHRDIKPGNVLVAVTDGKPVAKVIDFGLAKATEQPLTDGSVLTQFGTIAGTPEYMSPEQADSSSQGVDTRTDVYSLGVVLYELLTGTTPLDSSNRGGEKLADVLEKLRRVREEEPPRPSARVRGLGERAGAIAGQRKTEPARLAKQLRGELDWIVMRALEKDRDRRYASAGDFAKDVQRYLDDEPVEACPPSSLYRVRKAAWKYRKLSLALASFVVVLVVAVVGLGLAVIGKTVANEEQRRAVRAAKGLREGYILTSAAVELMTWKGIKLKESEKEFLREALHRVDDQLRDPGPTREAGASVAAWQMLGGNICVLIGDPNEAEARYATALQLYEQLADQFPDDPLYRHQLAKCNFNLGILWNDLGKPSEAEAAYRRAAGSHERLAADFPANSGYRRGLADAWNNLGTLLRDQQDLPKAEKAFRQAVTLGEKLIEQFPGFPDDQINLAASCHNLGNAVRDQGDAKTALGWYGKAIELLTSIKERPPSAVLFLRNAYWDRANALGQLGRHAEAGQDWQRAIVLDVGPDRDYLRIFLATAQMEEKLITQSKPAGQLLYVAAGVHARATAAAAATKETGLQKQYASRALDLLRQARSAGWFSEPQRLKQLKEEKAFTALPPDDFKSFLQNLDAGKAAVERPDPK